FSPDGKRIASASDDKTVRVWSADGRGAPVVLRGHGDAVAWVEFSPDGGRIVSASKDGTIRLWPADGGGEPVILTGHECGVAQVRFSPDGRRIASTGSDHTVRLWRELGPASLDDLRLWQATSYCLPVERRVDLLAASPEQARLDRQRCAERVARALAQ
ncbi:MAG TPA: protein kinase, partial [Kofleriaceae bacterium]